MIKTKKISAKITLISILVLAFILRILFVWKIPPSLNWDEVSIGYNAYSVLKTGKDEWGAFLPLHFKAFGEFKLPVHIYASIPGIAIFGLNELGVRITPVLFGVLAVFFTYLLAKEVFKSHNIGLLSAFLLAVSPWHLQLSRASLESATAMSILTGGMYFFWKGLRRNVYLIPAAIMFGLTIYTYNAERAFVPLFIFVLVLIFRKKLFQKENIKNGIIAGLIFFLFIARLLPTIFSSEGSSRFKLVSITDDPGFVLRINEARGNTNLPEPLPRLIHNKATHFIYVFGNNYLAHYSPDFLFINGAGHKQHHVQGIGELYLIEAPFLAFGIYYLLKKNSKEKKLFFASWILLSAIPVAITFDSIPHALRTLLVLPSYQILASLGFITVFKKHKSKAIKLLPLIIAVFVIQFGVYLNRYYKIYPKAYSRDWQYGYRQVYEYLKENEDQYDRYIISRAYGEPHIFALFFLKIDPNDYQTTDMLERYQANDWVWVTQYNNFYFPDLGDEGTRVEDMKKQFSGKGKTLIVGKPSDFSENDKILKNINFLNGDEAFYISEF